MAAFLVKDSVVSNRTACLRLPLPATEEDLREAALEEFGMPSDIDVHLMLGSKLAPEGPLNFPEGEAGSALSVILVSKRALIGGS